MDKVSKHFDTEVLHNDQKNKRNITSKVTPIYQTSAFVFKDLDELEGYYHGNGQYLYSRVANPNTDELADAVARLEGAEDGVAASSGLSAILAGVLAVVKSGDHIVAADDLYGGSFHMLKAELNDLGIETSFVSFSNLDVVDTSKACGEWAIRICGNTMKVHVMLFVPSCLRVKPLPSWIDSPGSRRGRNDGQDWASSTSTDHSPAPFSTTVIPSAS